MSAIFDKLRKELTALIEQGNFQQAAQILQKKVQEAENKEDAEINASESQNRLTLSSRSQDFTLLHLVAYFGLTDLIPKILIRDKSLLNQRTSRKPYWGQTELVPNQTALIIAVLRGHVATAEALLQAGADPTIDSETPKFSVLACAARMGFTSLCDLLIEKGVNPNHPNRGYYPEAPLVLALRNGHDDTAQLLLEKGASIDSLTVEHYSPPYVSDLHQLINEGHLSMLPTLLGLGIDLTIGEATMSPAMAAGEREDVVRALPKFVSLFKPEIMQNIADIVTAAYIQRHPEAGREGERGAKFLQDSKEVDELLRKTLDDDGAANILISNDSLKEAALSLLHRERKIERGRKEHDEWLQYRDLTPRDENPEKYDSFEAFIASETKDQKETKDRKEEIEDIDPKLVQDKMSGIKSHLKKLLADHIKGSYLSHDTDRVLGPFIQRELAKKALINEAFTDALGSSLDFSQDKAALKTGEVDYNQDRDVLNALVDVSFASLGPHPQGFGKPNGRFGQEAAVERARELNNFCTDAAIAVLQKAGIDVKSRTKPDQKAEQEHKRKQEDKWESEEDLQEEARQQETQDRTAEAEKPFTPTVTSTVTSTVISTADQATRTDVDQKPAREGKSTQEVKTQQEADTKETKADVGKPTARSAGTHFLAGYTERMQKKPPTEKPKQGTSQETKRRSDVNKKPPKTPKGR